MECGISIPYLNSHDTEFCICKYNNIFNLLKMKKIYDILLCITLIFQFELLLFKTLYYSQINIVFQQ